MITFEHTGPGGKPLGDRPPSIFMAVVLVLCAVVLLPFTLLVLLWWGVARWARG
jgi:hypothetical protein